MESNRPEQVVLTTPEKVVEAFENFPNSPLEAAKLYNTMTPEAYEAFCKAKG